MPRVEIGAVESAGDIPCRSTNRAGARLHAADAGAVDGTAVDAGGRHSAAGGRRRAGADCTIRGRQNCGMNVHGHADGVDDNTLGRTSRSISGIGRYRIPHGVSRSVAGGIRTRHGGSDAILDARADGVDHDAAGQRTQAARRRRLSAGLFGRTPERAQRTREFARRLFARWTKGRDNTGINRRAADLRAGRRAHLASAGCRSDLRGFLVGVLRRWRGFPVARGKSRFRFLCGLAPCGQFGERVIDSGALGRVGSAGIRAGGRKGGLGGLRIRLSLGRRQLNDHRAWGVGRCELSPRQYQNRRDGGMQQQGHREAYSPAAPQRWLLARGRRPPSVRGRRRRFRRWRRTQHVNSPRRFDGPSFGGVVWRSSRNGSTSSRFTDRGFTQPERAGLLRRGPPARARAPRTSSAAPARPPIT
jgi:hypothetical protein